MGDKQGILKKVITAKEASELYGISDRGVRDACLAGRVACRKSGTTWLILREDAETLWEKKSE